MATSTYKAQLNYHDSRWGWGNESTASQGAWNGTGTRTGVLYFPGLAALKNKIIHSVKLTVTTGETGYGLATTKTVNVYRSASQGGIKTSLGAGHRTGSAIGNVKGAMYNNTVTHTASFLAARIAAGEDTYCIYNGSSYTDYLKWTAVSLEVNWSEPATQPTLSKSTVEMGTAVTISTPAVDSGYRHTLRYVFGSASGTIASGVASAQSWTPPISLAAQIPSAASGAGTIYCDTYSGSTKLGTKSVAITLTVPASVKPTAGKLTAALVDDTSGTGMYVKGMGKARLTLSGAAGAQGSTIRSTVISGGGWSSSGATLTTGVLQTAGTIFFAATVTDSRGRSASTTVSLSVIDYARPGIASCIVYRCGSDGTKQNDGTYAAVEISAFYSAISGNTLSLKVAYKKSSATSYGSSTNLTNKGKTIIGGGGLSPSVTYDVRVTVSDKYNTVEQVYSLPTKSVLLSFLKNLGAAVGKVAELSGWLDIGWHTRIRGNLQVDGGVLIRNLGVYTDMQTAGWAAIQAWYNALSNLSTAHAYISSSSAAHGLPTGTTHLVAHKNSNNYGSVIAYYNYPPVIRYSTINEGNWIDFTPATATTTAYIPTEAQSAAAVSRLMLAQLPEDDETRLLVSGLYAPWTAGAYAVGDLCNTEGQTWICFQAHDCAENPDITPDNAAWFTFWRPLHGQSPETARPFVPVQGAHDLYKAGEYAVYNEQLYRCVQDTAYSPEDYPPAWEETK